MKHKKNLFLCLIALLAIFSIVSCAPTALPDGEDGIENVTSDNLDAWRDACSTPEAQDLENSKKDKEVTIDVNLTVTGTVVANTGFDVYIQDDNQGTGTLHIYAGTGTNALKFNGKSVPVGSKITLTIKKIMKFNDGFQTKTKYLTVDNVVEGTVIEPMLVTDKAKFLSMGTDLSLDYVTIYCKITRDTGEYGDPALILTEAEYNKLKADPTAELEEKDREITIFTKYAEGAPYTTGDLVKLTGNMSAYKKVAQLAVQTTDERIKADRDTIDSTITAWKKIINSSDAPALTDNLKMNGYILDVYQGKYNKEPSKNLDIYVVEDGATGNVIKLRLSCKDGTAATAEKNKYKAGNPVTVVAKNISPYEEKNQYSCTNFDLAIDSTKENKDITTLAREITTSEAYNKCGVKESEFVKFDLTVTEVNNTKDNKSFKGYFAGEDATKAITIKDWKMPEDLKADDVVTVYTRVIQDKTNLSSFVVKTEKKAATV